MTSSIPKQVMYTSNYAMGHRIGAKRLKISVSKLILAQLFILVWVLGSTLHWGHLHRSGSYEHQGASALAQTQAQGEQKDIQWFRKTMNIAPKYQEQSSGVLGMSWPHFILMIFLLLFFIATLFNYYVRSKRTRQILRTLLEEDRSQGG